MSVPKVCPVAAAGDRGSRIAQDPAVKRIVVAGLKKLDDGSKGRVGYFWTAGQYTAVDGGPMTYDLRQTAWDVLRVDDEACVTLFEPFGTDGQVQLIEGALSVPEAIAYVHLLMEMGLEAQAEEVFDALLAVVLGAVAPAIEGVH